MHAHASAETHVHTNRGSLGVFLIPGMNLLYASCAQIAGGKYRAYSQMRNAVPAELNLSKYLEIRVISARAFAMA